MTIYSFPSLNSTNEYAMENLQNEKLPFGVFAYEQKKGKGQQGNVWLSAPSQNILFSWAYQPQQIQVARQFWISQAISLGILDFLKPYVSNVYIKWPNDIYVGVKKIGGILIEHKIMDGSISKTVIGIGLNINQTDFSPLLPNPTSLALLTSRTFILEDLLPFLVQCIHLRLTNENADVQEEYLSSLLQFKKQASYLYKGKAISAQIEGVDMYGYLQLKTADGELILADLKEIVFQL